MGAYYGFWNVMLLFPEKIRRLVEVFLIAMPILFLWPVGKYLFAGLVWIRIWLNQIKVGSVRLVLPIFRGERKYIWDEWVIMRGSNKEKRLRGKYGKIVQSRRRDVLKWKSTRVIFICLYILAILPSFQLEKYVSGHYVDYLYGMNYFLVYAETKATEGIENYPPFWGKETEEAEREEEVEPAQEPAVEQLLYLKLNDGTSYANVREAPDIRSESIRIVSKEDEILYQYMYEYDSKRFWLKVLLPSHDNLEGWISANVLEREIVDALNLQY